MTDPGLDDLYRTAMGMLADPAFTRVQDSGAQDDAGDENPATPGCDHPADTPEPREGTS